MNPLASALPTPLDCSESEFAMCKEFYRQILQYKAWRQLEGVLIFHISNGQRAGGSEKSRKIAGSIDKAMGVVKGVSDYCVIAPDFVGFMEAKRYYTDKKTGKIKKSQIKPEQTQFAKDVEALGFKHTFFYTPQEGLDALRKWGVLA